MSYPKDEDINCVTAVNKQGENMLINGQEGKEKEAKCEDMKLTFPR